MKEITTHFAIIDPELIRDSLALGENVSCPSRAPRFVSNRKVIFSQEHSSDDSGSLWRKSFRAVCTDPAVQRFNGASAYPAFWQSDETMVVMGGAFSVPRIIVTPSEGGVFVVTASIEEDCPTLL